MFAMDGLSLILADFGSAVTAAYWACLIIGGGLLLLSLLGGLGHDTPDVDAHAGLDFHTDVHADVDTAGAADIHVDAGHADVGHADTGHADVGHAGGIAAVSTWLSLRFVVFFMAVFGAVGIVLTYVTHARAGAAFAAALVAGIVCGQAVHQTFRAIRRRSGDSTPQLQDYVNRLGRVTIGIDGTAAGEVAIQVRGEERYLPAVARGARQRFSTGDEVVVVAYRGGVAEVVSRSEFENGRSA